MADACRMTSNYLHENGLIVNGTLIKKRQIKMRKSSFKDALEDAVCKTVGI